MQLTVIVPVYQVEKYITTCIKSLLQQTDNNFMTIIVDDGSPDNSINMAKQLVKENPKFKFISQKNKGLSSARNFGLEHTTTEYVMFLDSDDFLSKNAIELINESIKKEPEVDAFLYGTNIIREDFTIIKKFMPNIKKYYLLSDFLLTYKSIDFSAWSKVYKKKLFDNLRFKENIKYEDKQLIPILIYDCKLSIIESFLYNYLQREGSIMSSYNKNSIQDHFFIFDTFYDFFSKRGVLSTKKQQRYFIYSFLLEGFLPIIINLAKYSPSYHNDSTMLQSTPQYKMYFTTKNILKSFGLFSKNSIALLLFKFSPSLFKKLIKS